MRRDKKGQFGDVVDKRTKATVVKQGEGDRGDQKPRARSKAKGKKK